MPRPPTLRRTGSFLLAFLQFGIVPLLIWRPIDETTMPVPKFVASHRLGPGDHGDNGEIAGAGAGAGTAAAAVAARQGGPEERPKWEDEEEGGGWDESASGRSQSPRYVLRVGGGVCCTFFSWMTGSTVHVVKFSVCLSFAQNTTPATTNVGR